MSALDDKFITNLMKKAERDAAQGNPSLPGYWGTPWGTSAKGVDEANRIYRETYTAARNGGRTGR